MFEYFVRFYSLFYVDLYKSFMVKNNQLMKKKLFISTILTCFSIILLSAQTISQSKGVIYNTELSGLCRFHTNGFTMGINYGTLKTYYKTNIWRLEVVNLKHPREYLNRLKFSPSQGGGSAGSFTYGKQNSFFALHAGFGQKYYFSGKADKQGVAVGMSYSVGPSLGFIKPYYIEMSNPNGNVIIGYSDETASSFLNLNSIVGSAGFGYGFDELSVVPGGQAKVALHLDWGAFEAAVQAIEVGLMVDFYTKQIPIMVTEDNKPYFFNLYFAVELGKRK